MASLAWLLGQEHWQRLMALLHWLCTTLTGDRPLHDKTPMQFGWEALIQSGLTLGTYQCGLGHDVEIPRVSVDAVPSVETWQ